MLELTFYTKRQAIAYHVKKVRCTLPNSQHNGKLTFAAYNYWCVTLIKRTFLIVLSETATIRSYLV